MKFFVKDPEILLLLAAKFREKQTIETFSLNWSRYQDWWDSEGVRKAQWRTSDANFHNLYCLSYKVQQVNIYPIVDMWITIRYYDRRYEQSLDARTNLNDETMISNCINWSKRVRRWYAYGNAQICVVTAAGTSLPYFGVKLSCVCLMFADRKK